MTQGFTEAAKRMETRAKVLRAQQGTLYRPDVSGIMQSAIDKNADKSYTNSPAKKIAEKSADSWQHSLERHLLRIMSTAYANYRQYGCGGLPITILVAVSEAERQQMRQRFADVLHNVR